MLFWLKVIRFILDLIIQGFPKGEAVSLAAAHFGLSESEIWRHGGF